MIDTLKETYGYLFEEKLIEEIAQVATLKNFNEGDVLIDFGDYIKKMPLLITGAIKILREDFDEGELLLVFYRKRRYLRYDNGVLLGRHKERN